jgi:hypothetical protein
LKLPGRNLDSYCGFYLFGDCFLHVAGCCAVDELNPVIGRQPDSRLSFLSRCIEMTAINLPVRGNNNCIRDEQRPENQV